MKLMPIKAYLMNRATLNRVSTYKKTYMLISDVRPVDIGTSAHAVTQTIHLRNIV